MITDLTPEEIRSKFIEAKEKRTAFFMKNAYKDVPTWSEFLNCIFQEIKTPNPELAKLMEYGTDVNERPVGNVIITEDYYFSPQISEIDDYFSSMLPLDRFLQTAGYKFGLSGPKVSLGPRYVAPHHDKWDAFTIQCQGTTTWIITDPDTNKKQEYFMEPGDLLFFPQETFHEISCSEARAGLIFNFEDVRKYGI